MTKLERRRLVALVKKYSIESRKANAWINKNFHKCGHSSTFDSLGDEGWVYAHQLGGKWRAYDHAAALLSELIREFDKKEKGKK